MKKVLIVISIVVLAIMLVLIGYNCAGNEGKTNNKDKDTVEEKNVASFDDQVVEGLEISGFNMLYENDITNMAATIKNTTDSDMKIENVEIYLYDENGKVITQIIPFFYVGDTLSKGEEKFYETPITGNVTNASRVEYKIVK